MPDCAPCMAVCQSTDAHCVCLIVCVLPWRQACTNTILAHFASIVFSNWIQKVLLKPGKAASSGFAKPNFPDYSQKSGPTGTIS